MTIKRVGLGNAIMDFVAEFVRIRTIGGRSSEISPFRLRGNRRPQNPHDVAQRSCAHRTNEMPEDLGIEFAIERGPQPRWG